MKHTYTIFQLNDEDIKVLREHKLFESWEFLTRRSEFDFNQYKKVYENEIEGETPADILETLFQMFNLRHPWDFKGHSLSVSDVVILDDVKYYCDCYGWVNVETGKKI